jgi:hypothetical protein
MVVMVFTAFMTGLNAPLDVVAVDSHGSYLGMIPSQGKMPKVGQRWRLIATDDASEYDLRAIQRKGRVVVAQVEKVP